MLRVETCYSRRSRAERELMSGAGRSFGFSPKISTPVENTVEKRFSTVFLVIS